MEEDTQAPSDQDPDETEEGFRWFPTQKTTTAATQTTYPKRTKAHARPFR